MGLHLSTGLCSRSHRTRTMKLPSGHTAEELDGEELASLRRNYEGLEYGLVRVTPGPWLFPKPFLRFADKYYNFQFRPSDVVLAAYPKSGTTWMQEIIWTMKNNPDLTNPDASALPAFVRSPFMEMDMLFGSHLNSAPDDQHPLMQPFRTLCPGRDPKDGVCLQIAECSRDPRTIKTHLPLSLLPPALLDTCKMIHLTRNPKDVMVSFYHHCRLINNQAYKGTWEDFVDFFMNNKLIYGSYAARLKEAWEKRDHPNMHIVSYEDLKADVMGELERLNAFLGTNLTLQQLENVARHTSFKEMNDRYKTIIPELDNPYVMNQDIRKNEGGFFRKGKAGDWQDKFSPELMAKVDAWIEENITSMGMNFKYSI